MHSEVRLIGPPRLFNVKDPFSVGLIFTSDIAGFNRLAAAINSILEEDPRVRLVYQKCAATELHIIAAETSQIQFKREEKG